MNNIMLILWIVRVERKNLFDNQFRFIIHQLVIFHWIFGQSWNQVLLENYRK